VAEPLGAPAGRVQLTDGTCEVVADTATGAERVRLWDQWRTVDKNLDGYARRRSTYTADLPHTTSTVSTGWPNHSALSGSTTTSSLQEGTSP
jgi:hypothetical protein